jgi:predicted nucleic acid-binding protein
VSVLVDTPIWSAALRRRSPQGKQVEALADLITSGEAELIGAVRQELLSGIRDPRQYERLREYLRAFVDVPLEVDDYEEAARIFNVCQARGIQGSHVDYLICATAIRRDMRVYTSDSDFERYAKCIPLHLHQA